MGKSRGILPPRRFWTEAECELMRLHYATTPSADLAKALGVDVHRVHQKAQHMGLKKDPALVREMARDRTRADGHGSHKTRFQRGVPSWSKGIKGRVGVQEACRATQFKAGQKSANWLPVGSFRVVDDGTLQQKYSDAPGSPTNRWKAYSAIVWEQAHGPIPEGLLVVFKPGRRTTDPEKVTPDALELVTRRELMARNTLHARYPPELRQVIQLRGQLTRQINRRLNEADEP